MILVTVGAQMPFDRLTCAVDAWAGAHGDIEIFAQIGRTRWRPQHMPWSAFLDPSEYRERMRSASAVVTHAGMGTIITALELGKPVLVMPRRADLRETRNGHQLATARAFASRPGICVAWSEAELPDALDRLGRIPLPARVGSTASPELISALRHFIGGDAPADAAPLAFPTPALRDERTAA